MIEALLFDFDGTLLDSETPAFRAWQDAYRALGAELRLEDWAQAIGTIDGFDPFAHLEATLGAPVDRTAIDDARRDAEFALLEREHFRPGVLAYLTDARELGLHIAIVSSSTDAWIAHNLERLETPDGWACIVCANNDVERAKPRPTLYLEALQTLGVPAGAAIAFEDSPNGVAAAKAARLFTVATPNAVTAELDLSAADLLLPSLERMPLAELLGIVGRRRAA